MKVLVESILDCFVEGLNSEIKSNVYKTILAIVFVVFFLFIVVGLIGFGIDAFKNNSYLSLIFVLFGILIFIYFVVKFIIIYNKKLNKALKKIKLFKIQKRK